MAHLAAKSICLLETGPNCRQSGSGAQGLLAFVTILRVLTDNPIMSGRLLLALIVAGRTCFAASSAAAQSPNLRVPLDGPSVFKAYCAACHGADGKGHGPAADALKAKPIDLTRIAANNKGVFPRATIEDVLTNGGKWKAHGSKDMPTWGPIFRAVDQDDNIATAHIHNLVTYLESIQVNVGSSGGSVSPRPVSAASPGTRPSALPVLYVGFVGLQALDAYSTLRGVNAGGREMNPLVGGLASPDRVLVAKGR